MAAAYDDFLEKITAPTLTTENWDGILTLCDRINSDPEGNKNGLKALRKRLNNRDPHVVLMAISVLDSCWANCGEKFRREVSSGQFINELKALCTNSQRLVAEKMRIALKKWVDTECANESSLSLIVSLYKQLKEDGHSFVVEDPKKINAVVNSKYANDPNFVSSAQEEEEIAKAIAASIADAEKHEKSRKSTTNLYPATKSNSNNGSSKAERKVRALYDFEAAEGNELSFVAGDVITVTDDSNSHWWTGRIGVQQGLFPASFVTSDLEDVVNGSASKETSSQQAPAVVASINEAILVRCLNVLHECDPTGERADPADLAQLEAASYAQGPLIDAHLTSIDRQTNSLAQVDIAIRDVLALYDDAIQKAGGYQQNVYAPSTHEMQYAQQPHQQQYAGYPTSAYQQYPQQSAQQQQVAHQQFPQYHQQQQAAAVHPQQAPTSQQYSYPPQNWTQAPTQ